MPDSLQQEIARLVSEAAARDGDLDLGEAFKQLVSVDERASCQRRELVNLLLAESLRAGVNPQLPIV